MRAFYKMSGSGNDFIFIDARREAPGALEAPGRIQALCARGTGIGADGIVFLEPDPAADVRIRYFNSDGSLAALCGNATLCTVRIASDLAIGGGRGLRIATDAGVVEARMTEGLPEFDLECIERVSTSVPVALARGERRLGFALVGVPHLVVEVDDLDAIDLAARGRALRSDAWTGAPGANVNFIAAAGDAGGGWAMRTYERGVEGETLACGTGAVASATLLVAWGRAADAPVRIQTRSGAALDVTVARRGDTWRGALRGEGRLVFRGELVDL
jgi:diaminopimelate epimerase